MASRRAFIASTLTACAMPKLGWTAARHPAYLATAMEGAGDYFLFGIDAAGDDLFRVLLPGRGHAAAAHPDFAEAVVFARRPGRHATIFDCAAGGIIRHITAPPGRHFYGHGVFVADGQLLCTTENHIESGRGLIGLWDRSAGWRRVGEHDSGGIGPHDIKCLADGTIVVANGGILTHPRSGRKKLNINQMRPNLSYVSAAGEIIDMIELEPSLRTNSIRHLAVRCDGTVAFAMQNQGDIYDATPLLGLHRRGRPPLLCAAPTVDQLAMRGYAGSVAFDHSGDTIAITSPRGGRIHCFGSEGGFIASHKCADVCGLAAADGGFVASDGMGRISVVAGRLRHISSNPERAWDNHLISVRGV